MNGKLADLTSYGFDNQAVDELQASVDRLLQNLSQQDDLVARRLAVRARFDSALTDALDAAIGLVDLSETLVANAEAGTSAVISNLYDLVEDPDKIERTLSALDRLVESDVYLMGRMFELLDPTDFLVFRRYFEGWKSASEYSREHLPDGLRLAGVEG